MNRTEHAAWLATLPLPEGFRNLAAEAMHKASPYWEEVDRLAFINQKRVLEAFQEARIGEEDFAESSGYGYNDRGREKLEAVFARIFGTEAALVRTQVVSGTHALAVSLFGLLRPGESVLFVTGPPYDTLQAAIGSRGEEEGTLREWGIHSHFLPQGDDGLPDLNFLDRTLMPRVVYLQRSAGYSLDRKALTVSDVRKIAVRVREVWPDSWIVVDNCYGEFVEVTEPSHAGADLVVGSLIKNPGGGLALSGGYIAGRRELMRKIAARLTAPGLYGSLGATGSKRSLFQGLFMAPQLTANALKNALFAAALLPKIGFPVRPRLSEARGDIVQAAVLGDPQKVQRFCRAVQASSPVEAYLVPEPAELPGYADPVIMAAGTFIQGASGEFSADAPMRPPYAIFLQGGLTLSHALWGTCHAACAVWEGQ